MYSREINNTVLTLSASGWTYQNTFVLYDYETESLWYHLSGQQGLTCISGAYADAHLEEFTSYQLRWNEWIKDHGDTQLLKYP